MLIKETRQGDAIFSQMVDDVQEFADCGSGRAERLVLGLLYRLLDHQGDETAHDGSSLVTMDL